MSDTNDKQDMPLWAKILLIITFVIAGACIPGTFGYGPLASPKDTIPYEAITEYDDIASKAPYELLLGSGEAAYADVFFKDYEIAGNHIVFKEYYMSPRGTFFDGHFARYWLKGTGLWSRPLPTSYDSGIVTVDAQAISAVDVATVFSTYGLDIDDFRPQ